MVDRCHDVSYDSDSNVCLNIVSAMSTYENTDTTEVLSEADISILDAFPPFPRHALSEGLMWASKQQCSSFLT